MAVNQTMFKLRNTSVPKRPIAIFLKAKNCKLCNNLYIPNTYSTQYCDLHSIRTQKQNRKIALKRDNFTCQDCGATDKLETHHIIPYIYSKDHSIKNLKVLCQTCHRKYNSELNDFTYNGVAFPKPPRIPW